MTIIGNAPEINDIELPTTNVVICNHFWRHKHYHTIKHGFHVISDKNFCMASDIDNFIKHNNQNIVIVCSKYVRKFLLNNGLFEPVILGVNYSGAWPIWDFGVRDSRINKICQTGSTVVADLALPLADFLHVKEVNIIGVTLNYGDKLDRYAFPIHHSVVASPSYMKKHFVNRATKSINHWKTYLESKGVLVKWIR